MRIIQISCLGKFGRFGNQLFQYCFAKALAEKHDCQLEVPKDWIGRKIFEISDQPIRRPLQRVFTEVDPDQINIDLMGYYQHQEALDMYSREDVLRWLKFKAPIANMFPKRRNYIAAHVRRGDYVKKFSNIYCCIKDESYIDACDKFGLDSSELIWVREDKPTASGPALKKQGLGFLPDFFKLVNADHMLRANSTFSWWAGVFSEGKVYSPLVEQHTGWSDVDFTEGNWPAMYSVNNHPDKKVVHTDLHLQESK